MSEVFMRQAGSSSVAPRMVSSQGNDPPPSGTFPRMTAKERTTVSRFSTNQDDILASVLPRPKSRATPEPAVVPIDIAVASKFRKNQQEEILMDRIKEKQAERKAEHQDAKNAARKKAKKIPVEVLVNDWMMHNVDTVETRIYLIDKILPVLTVGLEHLLMQVEQRGQANIEQLDHTFNPLNYLAQYMMRNNPRYCNFSEASPYVRGMRKLLDDLRMEMLGKMDLTDNRMARVKAEARARREARENREKQLAGEKRRREELLRHQFPEWNAEMQADVRLKMSLVQNALHAFLDIVEHLPENMKKDAQYSEQLDSTDNQGKTMSLYEFVTYMKRFVNDMSVEVFDIFMRHLSNCARLHRSHAEKSIRRAALNYLFIRIDRAGTGLLDRHRVLELFEMFYDRMTPSSKPLFRNPRKWPVIDMSEMERAADSDDEEQKDEGLNDDDKPLESETHDNNEEQSSDIGREELLEGHKHRHPPPSHEISKQDNAEDGAINQTVVPSMEQRRSITITDPKPILKPSLSIEVNNQTTAAEPLKTQNSQEGSRRNSLLKNERESSRRESAAEPQTPDADVIGTVNEMQSDADRQRDTDAKQDIQDMKETEDTQKSTEQQQKEQPQQQPRGISSKVSFEEAVAAFKKEQSFILASRPQTAASAFDENNLNAAQFIQVTESFMGEAPTMNVFRQLASFVREGYVETEEERMIRITKARNEAREATRKVMINGLFDLWDNNGSGYLDLDEVVVVMKKYKQGLEVEAIESGKKVYRQKKITNRDNRLSKREFRDFVTACVIHMADGGETFENFVEFLSTSVQRSYEERMRGSARKKWLQTIITAAETGAATMDGVYKAVFTCLYKDAEAHSAGKMISAYVALLERNSAAPERGSHALRYTAVTADDSPFMLGKALYKDMRGVSFAAIETGKPVHVPKVRSHGHIHFWRPERLRDDRDGSFIAVPLKDTDRRVFGLLGVDTMKDINNRTVFVTHEIQFYQGVAKSFSIAYHYVDIRQKLLRIAESAVAWIHRRSLLIKEVAIFLVEPDIKTREVVLRKVMATDAKAKPLVTKNPPRMEKKDNLFRDYLFTCVENSESINASAYGEYHMAVPLRDSDGKALVAVDVNIGDVPELPKRDAKEVMRMLQLLQLAFSELNRASKEGAKTTVFDGEEISIEDDAQVEVLFDQLLLKELRSYVANLKAPAYSELSSYTDPPPVVHNVLKSVLAMFYPKKARAGEFDNWFKCRTYMGTQLGQKILALDPTSDECDVIPLELINGYLAGVPYGSVSKQGSLPAEYMYNWVYVCASMIEHHRKMKEHKEEEKAIKDKGSRGACEDGDDEEVEEDADAAPAANDHAANLTEPESHPESNE